MMKKLPYSEVHNKAIIRNLNEAKNGLRVIVWHQGYKKGTLIRPHKLGENASVWEIELDNNNQIIRRGVIGLWID